MRVSIHQPMYLPWIGLFERIYKSDLFILLDNVPYSKNYFLNRNKIKIQNGWTWLTVPVFTGGNFGQLIKDIRIDNGTGWSRKHWLSIYYAYGKAPYFSDLSQFFEESYQKEWECLAELSEYMLIFLLRSTGIKTPVIKASSLNVEGKKEELLLNICEKVGAKEYLSGPDGQNYLNLDLWEKNDIKVDFHNYMHPEYPQLHGEFLPYMSIVDLLFNCGQKSLNILVNREKEESIK